MDSSNKGPLFTAEGADRTAPRPASTVLLLRPGAPFEVYLVKRASKSAFMGGIYVFPGGKLDAADADSDMLARFAEGEADRCGTALDASPGSELPAATSAGLFAAACREVFEEVGVLLARSPSSPDYVSFSDDSVRARFEQHRAALNERKLPFAKILEDEDLTLATDGICYLAHWITPSREGRRYDTRFFVCVQPDGQEPIIDRTETTQGAWMTPAAALEAYYANEIDLSPPTIRILEDIGARPDVSSVLEFARGREVSAILPKIGMSGERLAILLPWDPAYPETEGESLDMADPHPMAEGHSRVEYDGERWRSAGG